MDMMAFARLRDLVEGNSAYRQVFSAIMAYCDQERDVAQVTDLVKPLYTSRAQLLDPASLVESLVRKGGLTRIIRVDGQEYAGSVQDLQADEAIPDDAEVKVTFLTTEEGFAAVEAIDANYNLESLFSEKPDHVDGFIEVLKAACAPDGVSTRELEVMLKGNPVLMHDPRTKLPTVYPSYFTGELERVGALAWDGKRWKATEKGKAALA